MCYQGLLQVSLRILIRKEKRRKEGVVARKESRFKKLSKELKKKGAETPDALAAWIGRRKYGAERFAEMSRRGRKKKNNPSTAEELSEEFHGRDAIEFDDIEECYQFPSELAKLGKLTQLEISDGEYVTPIDFSKPQPDLCSTSDAKQLILVGGNQSLSEGDLEEFGVEDKDKQYITLGYAVTLSYKTDKHHLSDSNGKEAEYIHELGEESGDIPMAVYDRLNKRILLVGGSYTVEDRWIVD